MDSRAVNVNGTTLHVVVHGTGEPVVLVHGSASDARTWKHQLDPLAHTFRVIAYSRRYHRPNEAIAAGADYSMHEHVADLEALLHLLGATPAHVVGHSYGALMALRLAMKSPDLVRSLVLEEPPAITLFTNSTPTAVDLLKLLVTRPRTGLAIAKLGALGLGPATAAARRGDMDAVMRHTGRAVLGRQAFDALSEARREQVRSNLIPAELLGSGFPPLPSAGLRTLRVPTLLVSGQGSPTVFHRLLDRLGELLPSAVHAEIPHASHIAHEDNPIAYNAQLLSFLRAHTSPP